MTRLAAVAAVSTAALVQPRHPEIPREYWLLVELHLQAGTLGKALNRKPGRTGLSESGLSVIRVRKKSHQEEIVKHAALLKQERPYLPLDSLAYTMWEWCPTVGIAFCGKRRTVPRKYSLLYIRGILRRAGYRR